MSAANIRQAIETIVLDELGSDFKVLPRQFDIEGNDDRSMDNGVSVLWGSMSEWSGGADQYLSLSQEFTINITLKGYVNSTDGKSVDKVDAAYAAINEVLKRCANDKLDQSTLVNNVKLRGVSAPRPFSTNQRDIVKIEIGLTVFYLIA